MGANQGTEPRPQRTGRQAKTDRSTFPAGPWKTATKLTKAVRSFRFRLGATRTFGGRNHASQLAMPMRKEPRRNPQPHATQNQQLIAHDQRRQNHQCHPSAIHRILVFWSVRIGAMKRDLPFLNRA
jgi:hypothetical protein